MSLHFLSKEPDFLVFFITVVLSNSYLSFVKVSGLFLADLSLIFSPILYPTIFQLMFFVCLLNHLTLTYESFKA